VYEFFSVVTHPRIWGRSASTPKQAWAQIEAWLGSPGLRLLGETEQFATLLARFVTLPRVREAWSTMRASPPCAWRTASSCC
jgi:hypothetical protein